MEVGSEGYLYVPYFLQSLCSFLPSICPPNGKLGDTIAQHSFVYLSVQCVWDSLAASKVLSVCGSPSWCLVILSQALPHLFINLRLDSGLIRGYIPCTLLRGVSELISVPSVFIVRFGWNLV
jgi:hypothetical protein